MISLIGRGGILSLTAIEALLFTLFFCTIFLPASWITSLYYGSYEFFFLGLILLLYTNFDKRSAKGGAENIPLRKSRYWSILRAYFSSELIIENPTKFTEEVPNNKPVLFCIHPHGIISLGVWANLLYAASDPKFNQTIPQLQSARIVTLSQNFFFPIWCQLLTSIGFIGSSAQSIKEAFRRENSVGIVIGGAEESLHSVPNLTEISLHINSRRGFIREALFHGAPLVPIFTFGEVDSFDVYLPKEGTRLYRFQRWLKEMMGFTTPFVTHLRPNPVPLVTVIGPPLVVPTITDPTKEDLDLFHLKYLEHLRQFYDRNKHLDSVSAHRTLVFR